METKRWCRGVEGQEHVLVLKEDGHPPHCQPMRDWVRASLTDGQSGRVSPVMQQRLDEDWECMHWEQCTRCRKKTRVSVFRADCPVASPAES
jgi:hypothetical protein